MKIIMDIFSSLFLFFSFFLSISILRIYDDDTPNEKKNAT